MNRPPVWQLLKEAVSKGVEYPTMTGPVDILATDKSGDFVLFELKLTRGQDKAIGQLMRYMGWVYENLAKDKQVRGFIVAKSIDEGLKYAVRLTKNIQLLEYEVKFKVSKIQSDLS